MDMLNDNGLAVTGWVVAGVLTVVGAAGYLYYSTKLHDLRQLNTALKYASEQNLKTIKKLTDANANTDRVLLEREKEIEQLKNQTQTIKTEIKEIYVHEPETKNWADTEIPKSIILRLQDSKNKGASDGKNNHVGKISGTVDGSTATDGMRSSRNGD